MNHLDFLNFHAKIHYPIDNTNFYDFFKGFAIAPLILILMVKDLDFGKFYQIWKDIFFYDLFFTKYISAF